MPSGTAAVWLRCENFSSVYLGWTIFSWTTLSLLDQERAAPSLRSSVSVRSPLPLPSLMSERYEESLVMVLSLSKMAPFVTSCTTCSPVSEPSLVTMRVSG